MCQKYIPVVPLDLKKFTSPEIADLSHLKMSQINNFKQYTRITVPYEDKGNQNFVCIPTSRNPKTSPRNLTSL